MGSQSLLHLGTLSVRLSMGISSLLLHVQLSEIQLSLVSGSYFDYVPSYLVCPVVREWWVGVDCMWEKPVGLWSKSSLEWASCSASLSSVVITINFVE